MAHLHTRPGSGPLELEADEARKLSGVHQAQTLRAPARADSDRITAETPLLVGSVPLAALSLRFEPIVSLADGRVIAHEAVASCEDGGFMAADELFERARLERRVGELGRTLREYALCRGGGMPVWLPVYPAELREGLLIRPDDPLSSYDSEVGLELSQATFSDLSTHVLAELAGRGHRIVLDDFGAGPATVAQLVELSPSYVKLSPSLLAGLATEARRRTALAQLVGMCDALGAAVVARGVDDGGSLDALIDCGVRIAQGRALGPPVAEPGAG